MANSVARITLGTLMLAGAIAGAAGVSQPVAAVGAISRTRSPWLLALVALAVAGVASVVVWRTARRPGGRHRR